jgi:hypothetical protein
MDDGMFFGREKLLARLLNVLHHNSLMITGERRIGKTTFLYHLKKVLEADEGTEYRFFPAMTDLQGVPEETFFHAVMGDVVDELRLTPETQASLRFRLDADQLRRPRLQPRPAAGDRRAQDPTSKKVRLALLIDEVDVLNEYSERINQRLRSIFMKTFSEHLVAIMSGVGIKRIWKSEAAPGTTSSTRSSSPRSPGRRRRPSSASRWRASSASSRRRWRGSWPAASSSPT